jgi:regulator of sigma E protease
MTAFSILQSSYAVIVLNILPYLIALIAIIFVHEFGHFYIGRLCGVTIETFSIGFGKEIFGFRDKHGTHWKFSWIPLGGYVKFAGDANAASLPNVGAEHIPGSLQAAKLWKRMAIVAAGPFANFLLTIVIYTGFFWLVGIAVISPKIGEILPNSAAYTAGLQVGDIIRKVDNVSITEFGEIKQAMILRGEEPVMLAVERGGSLLNFTITPRIVEVDDGFGRKIKLSQIGIGGVAGKEGFTFTKYSLLGAVKKSVDATWQQVKITLRYIGKIFVGQESASQMRGPVGTVEVAGKFASLGPLGLMEFIALISVSIGLINLFPIPMLDGGHLVFYTIEAILGKPVSPKTQEWSFRIGLTAILMLMILVTLNDLGRFWA